MIPVPIIEGIRRTGRDTVWVIPRWRATQILLSYGVDFRQAGAIEYRMVDGDPTRLEVVE